MEGEVGRLVAHEQQHRPRKASCADGSHQQPPLEINAKLLILIYRQSEQSESKIPKLKKNPSGLARLHFLGFVDCIGLGLKKEFTISPLLVDPLLYQG
jgi:hypothetical protein